VCVIGVLPPRAPLFDEREGALAGWQGGSSWCRYSAGWFLPVMPHKKKTPHMLSLSFWFGPLPIIVRSSATSQTLYAHERLPMARRAEHPTPARPKSMPPQGKRALAPTTTFSFKKNCNQVPNAEGDISSMEPRRDDATSTVCCVDGGDEPRSRRAWLQNNAALISVTASKPTGSSAPSRSSLICLECRELPIQCAAVADVAQ